MKRSMQWLVWAGLGWLGLASVRAQVANLDHKIHFDDFGVGEVVERLDPAGVLIPGGAVVETGFPTASSAHFLARKPFANQPPGSDPEPLVLRFDQPQSVVGFAVGDNGGKSRRVTVQAFDSKDATKPIVSFQVSLPAQVGVTTPVRFCRVLEQDIHRIEVTSPDGAVEAIDDLELRRYPTSTRTQVTFDDRPIGTVVGTQYPGVAFLDNPEIRGTELIGVDVRSGNQALHQRVNGEGPARPLLLNFNPPQGAVRVHVGYPAAENNGGPLRVVFRAYAGGPKASFLAAEHVVSLDPGTPIRIPLEVCRRELDIHQVQVSFDRPAGGLVVLDDLEFGPVTPNVVPPDTSAPQVTFDAPVDGVVIPQPSPRPEHRTTTIRITGRVTDNQSIASARLQVISGDGSAPYDDSGFRTSLTGTGLPLGFDVPVLLTYGTNIIRLSAVDDAGNTGVREITAVYVGPPPIRALGAAPTLAYPQITFREASPTGPFLGAPDPIVSLTTENVHENVRVFLVPEVAANIPPSAPDLIDAEVVSRNPDGTGLRVRVPAAAFNRPGRYVWMIWDLWSRPGMVSWTRAGEIELRQWPYPALWSLGFMNRDETNGIAEFEGVFGNEIAPGFLETNSDLGGCARGTSAVSYFLDTFDPGMNGAPGSCYGFAALTQLLAGGWYESTRFDPAVRYPTGFREPGSMLFRGSGCTPQVPTSLWAHIQTYYGVQYSFEELVAWNEQVELDGPNWVGDPLAVAHEIRGAETLYTIGIVPPGTMAAGHAVAPYRVEDRDANTVRIWVVDSNAPYDVNLPEEHIVNQIALHRFIDIDRRNNTYRFHVGASTNRADEYQNLTGRVFRGQGIAFTRVGVFTAPRTIPGASAYIRHFFSVTGDADPHVEVEGRGEFGWKADGSYVSTLSGITPFPGFGFAGDEVRQPLILVPTNDTVVRFTARARGPQYRFRAAGGGVILGLQRNDAATGTSDTFDVVNGGGVERGFQFTPGSKTRSFVPSAIATDSKTFETAVEWVGLQLGSAESIAVSIEPNGRRCALRNDSDRPLHFGVILRATRAGVDNAFRRVYGPFDLEAGATLQLDLSDKPGDFTLAALIDADGDGKAERIRDVTGVPVDVLKGSPGDCNQNGRADLLDILVGDEPDNDANGIPDGCSSQGGGTPSCPPDGTHAVKLFELPDGAAPTNLDGITTLGREARIHGGVLAATPVEGALGDPAGLEFRFRCPRGFVRLDLRLPTGYEAPKNGPLPVATVYAFSSLDATKASVSLSRTLSVTGTNGFELLAPLDQDIARIEVVYSEDLIETVAALEHGTYVAPIVTRIDFEDLAPGTPVEFQYPGLRVLNPAAITTTDFLHVATASGTQALRRVSDAIPDNVPLRFRLSPPQVAVRVRVGFPPVERLDNPLRVILRGYDVKGRLLASDTNRFTRETAIRTPLTVTALNGDRLASFAVEYVPEIAGTTSQHPGIEVVDDIEFGPYAPGAANDRLAPAVTLTSPSEDPVTLDDPAATTRNIIIQGLVREPNGIADFSATVVNLATGNAEEIVGFEAALSGLAPNYNFLRGIVLPLGEFEIRITATDYVGNSGLTIARVATLPFPPIRIDRLPPSTALDYMVRDRYFTHSDDTQPLSDFEVAFGTVGLVNLGDFDGLRIDGPDRHLIDGANFHSQLRLFLAPTNAVPGADPAGWDHSAMVPISFSVTDATRAHINARVPVHIAQQLGSRWRWLVQDPVARPGAVEWTVGTDLRVLPEVTRLHAFPFVNRDDTVGFGMYDTVFGNTVYIQNPICDFRDPVALVTYLVFKIWMDNTRGSCVGFSATAQMLRNGLITPERFYPNAHYAAGMYPENLSFGQFPLPEVHNNPFCGPRTPANLWAFIRGMQGVQTSTEFVTAWLDQLHGDGFGSVGGRPNNVLAMIRDHPENFVLTMVPSVGTGHAVAPYEIVDIDSRYTRIRVYDPNHPSHRVHQESWGFRSTAASQYILVDRIANTYQFFLNSRDSWNGDGRGDVWSGNGLYALPIRIWTGPRHWMLSLSGIVDLVSLPFSFGTAGDATPFVTSGTNQWGWAADGKFVDRFPGVAVPPLVGNASLPHTNALVLFTKPPGDLHIDMRSQGGDYHVALANGRTVWDLQVHGSRDGAVDRFVPLRSEGTLTGFDITPAGDATRVVPAIGIGRDETNRIVLRWGGLELPAGGRVGIDADADRGESRIRNHTGRPLRPRLVVEGATADLGNHVFALPPFDLPAGAHLTIRSIEGVASGRFEVDADSNGDGTPESRVVFTAARLAAPGANGVADRNENGAADAVDIALGTSADTNANGIPDEVEALGTLPTIRVASVDAATGRVELIVEPVTEGTVLLERSTDLLKWEKVAEGNPVGGIVELRDLPGSDRAFYRATLLR